MSLAEHAAPAVTVVEDLALETRGLTKRYGDQVAVDGLTLGIRRGEVFGLLGPNGAGKTTTILMLLGLTEPTDGSALVDGLDPRFQPLPVKRRVGYLPDDVGFYDDLTARENLRYTARLNRMPRATRDGRIDELLADVGLTDAADRRVGTFSRGMRQRLGLADALMKQPRILILDEPTVNIDPEGVRELLDLVSRLRDDEGMTVLLSSHLLHQVEQVCDRIGIFVGGRLAALGTIGELAAGLEEDWVYEVGVDVTAPEAADALGHVLGKVPGVRSVERVRAVEAGSGPGGAQHPQDRTARARWEVRADHDVHAALVDAVHDAGLALNRFVRRGADLDAIYHRYFSNASPASTDGDDGNGADAA